LYSLSLHPDFRKSKKNEKARRSGENFFLEFRADVLTFFSPRATSKAYLAPRRPSGVEI